MNFKLPYGLRDNQLLSIDEVESGLACNCICPACEKQLIARKGEKKSHHFAHYKSEDCLSGLETALHRISKDIIAKSKTFTTPILYYPDTHYEIFEETEIPIDNVKLETKVGEIIPDIVIETKGKKLLIEIVVTNPVTWQKLQRIKSENLPTIEINAKFLLERLYTHNNFGFEDNLFQTELLFGSKYKKWLHNPRINPIKQNLKDNYAEIKKVKSFKIKNSGYYNYVDECPLEKRTWKSGKNIGKPYASISHDCVSCNFCMFIDYKYIPHKKLVFYEYSIPQKVFCLGYLKDDFNQLIKQIR